MSTQVAWAPGRAATLVSASDDGLVLVFDFSEQVDEDDSWRGALNLDGAVAKMGFYGTGGEKLWMASQLAGLHLWEWAAACSEDAPGALKTYFAITKKRMTLPFRRNNAVGSGRTGQLAAACSNKR